MYKCIIYNTHCFKFYKYFLKALVVQRGLGYLRAANTILNPAYPQAPFNPLQIPARTENNLSIETYLIVSMFVYLQYLHRSFCSKSPKSISINFVALWSVTQ